ncbi:MAG: type II secretion system protein [Planctomycetota bacterium]|jgi:prepilin-type N-terminal cleavage/methylation domain-containing protein
MSRTRRPAGFTLVEMLVVVSIIGILLGILLPALGGVQRRARKANELNNIRQVGFAWNAYAGSNNDAAVPGYVTTRVQEKWRSSFELPDGQLLPPAPGYDTLNVTGPWTWRLLPYLSYNFEVIRNYLDDDEAVRLTSVLDDERNLVPELALAVAETPAFGYNGFYVGGYWEMYQINNAVRPKPRFFDVRALEDSNLRVDPVAMSIGSIQRSAEMIVFCSAARRSRGTYRRREAANAPGSDLVTPPFLAERVQWVRPGFDYQGGPSQGGGGQGGLATRGGSVYDIEVVNNNALAPLGRYNGLPALLYADGHTESQTYGGLFDQRSWLNDTRKIGNTPAAYFQHSDTNFSLAE